MASRNLGYSGLPENDEEASLRLARQLDAELNAAPKSTSLNPDYDASLALAMQLEAEWNSLQGQVNFEEQSTFANNTPDTASLSPFSAPPEVSLRGGGGNSHQQAASSGTFRTLNDFISYLRARKCTQCSTLLIQGQTDVDSLFNSWLAGQVAPSSFLKCKRCSTSVCVGCTSRSSNNKTSTQVTVQNSNTQLSWCCGRGRLFLIWAILCGFDQKFSEAKQREATKTGTGRRNIGGGVGYDGSLYVGPMFGAVGRGLYSQTGPDPSKLRAQNAQQQSDNFNKPLLEILEELLPSLDRNSSFDMSPPEAVADILLSSKILNYCAELLRNDSLEDATKRKELYQALLNVLRILGQHPVTAQKIVYTERVLRPDAVNIVTLSFQGNAAGTRRGNEDTTSSLADGLRNLNVQSNIMLKGAMNNQKEFHTQEGQDMLWLCRQVSDLSEYLLRQTAAGSGGLGCGNKTEALDQGITEAPDQEIFETHNYGNQAKYIQSPPGRMKRLITEITTLKTGLPAGIVVKYASSRPDLMKIVIVGPAGTPYENGLFEFDLLCPQTYPHQPPKVLFKGTSGGRVRFNPNLHADGKVCLSLLGTYEGEPWKATESTILQVLISIQAMILCEDPLCNEPGFNGLRGSAEGRRYNQSVRSLTVHYAMLDWLNNPPQLWKELVTQHFRKNKNKILQTVTQWESGASSNYGRGRGIEESLLEHQPTERMAVLKSKLQAALQNPGQGSGGGQRRGGSGNRIRDMEAGMNDMEVPGINWI